MIGRRKEISLSPSDLQRVTDFVPVCLTEHRLRRQILENPNDPDSLKLFEQLLKKKNG